jgi:hypothetical protein
MAQKSCEATGHDKLTVLADRGYFKGEQILDCERKGESRRSTPQLLHRHPTNTK